MHTYFSLLSFVRRQCELVETDTNATQSISLKFCDDNSHNRYAPTKQNQMCGHRSVLDVILRHPDFVNKNQENLTSNNSGSHELITKFTYKKRTTTRYILILDETQDTMVRESWTFLRLAIRNWVVYDLPTNTEVGVLLANDTGSSRQFDLTSLAEEKNRNLIASFIPFSPGESQKPACMNCAVRDAQAMLEKQSNDYGAASSIILIIAPGMDVKTDYLMLGQMCKKEKIRITTINYPGVIHRKPLDSLAKLTSGLSYTLFESKQNSERSYLTTYFNLVNMLHHIMVEYYEGNRLDLPIEIHRKKLFDINDDQSAKRRSITGSFLLDYTMGAPSAFLLYTHNTEYPLINSAILNSPSGVTYLKRSDERLSVKQLSIEAQINETGSWTYTIDRFNGNPQPHFVQVMATAHNDARSAITVNAWIDQRYGSVIIYVEVKRGKLFINEAFVEMTVHRLDVHCDMSSKCEETIRIFDTGSGDPDITRGDGIYSRYFNPVSAGAGIYQFDIQVTDNGNTAYSLSDGYNADLIDTNCCGSFVPHPSKQPLPSFQRIVPTLTVFVGEQQIHNDIIDGVGSIGDLRIESIDTAKIRLSWTAPDMCGLNVARYEVRYAFTVQDIVDSFSTSLLWKHDSPLAFSIGDHTAFTMNISADPSLIGKTIFIAVRPYARLTNKARAGHVSNYVRVQVPAPALPATTNTPNVYQPPYDEYDNVNIVNESPYYSLIIIIIIIGTILLVCFVAFSYFCLIKRRTRESEKKSKNSMNSGNSIHQIPSPSPPKQDYMFDHSSYIISPKEIPDPLTVGLPCHQPIDVMIDQQQYSIVQDRGDDLFERRKQENKMIYRSYGSTDSCVSNSNTNTLSRNEQQKILSPYQSWTASRLLHEHERRHSSLDDIIHPIDHIIENDIHHNNDHISLLQNGERLSAVFSPMEAIINLTPMNSPPVPPLPYTTSSSGYPINYQIYSSGYGGNTQTPPMSNYSSLVIRSNDPPQIGNRNSTNNNNNSSLRGSLCSVHSGNDMKKKTRTITMV